MAVATTNAFSGPFTANGVTTIFPFTFTVLSGADVTVTLRDADGVETTVSANDYSVTLTGDGPSAGSVTFDVAPAIGNTVWLYLDPAFTQETEFVDGHPFLAGAVNNANDRAALRDQVLRRDVDRALLVPIGEAGVALPTAAERADKALFFDAVGDPDPQSLNDFSAAASAQADRAEGYALTLEANAAGGYYNSVAEGVADAAVEVGEAFNVIADGRHYVAQKTGPATGEIIAEYATTGFAEAISGPGGAGEVGFTQAGIGAVATTVLSHLRYQAQTTYDYMTSAQITDARARTSTADMTAVFHAARDAAGVGGTVLVKRGLYYVANCTLNVEDQCWVFEAGSEVRSTNGATTDAFIVTADGVSMRGVGVIDNGALAAGASYHCIKVNGADNVTIKGLSVGGAKGPCIGVYDADNTNIIENQFFNTWYAAVYAQPLTKNMTGISISGNTVTNTTSVGTDYKYGFNVHTDGAAAYSITDVVITGNRLRYPLSTAQFPLLIEVYGGPTTSRKIISATITGNSTYGGGMGCSLSGVEVATVTGNTVLSPYKYGIEGADTKTATISANVIKGGERGIALSSTSSGNITMAGNAISGTTSACIYASQVTAFVSITGGSLAPVSGQAITMLSCKNWAIGGGLVADGSGGGKKVVLLDKSDRGTISGISAKDFTENAVLFFADDAVAYNRVTVSNCVWESIANSLVLTRQLSGGATTGRQFTWIGNVSDADTSYRRDYLDVTNNIVDFMGAGTPEGVFSAGVGSIFRRTDGGASTTLYVKQTGTGNTGWAAK